MFKTVLSCIKYLKRYCKAIQMFYNKKNFDDDKNFLSLMW